MGRLIDEDDAINAILREYNTDDSDFPTDYQQGLSAAKKIIEQLSSVQPEPDTIYSDGFCDGYKQGIKDAQSKIVCCKDCKYFETDYWVNSILTHEICAICECAVKPDGYCFMAERREQ